MEYIRGQYGELYCRDIKLDNYHSIISDLKNQPDEHGWTTGGSWDKKGRGSQISIDLYGVDIDKNLYTVHVRQTFRYCASYFLSIRKSYFLIGRNENGNAFAHCVGASAIRAAINNEDFVNPVTAVNAAIRWIWGTDRYTEIVRHGDVGLLPVLRGPKIDKIDKIGAHVIMVVDSHQLYSGDIRSNGKLYAKNPYMHHLKNQHPDVKVCGWCMVIIGRREPSWDFAPITKD